jgi:hypothetical protein
VHVPLWILSISSEEGGGDPDFAWDFTGDFDSGLGLRMSALLNTRRSTDSCVSAHWRY